MELEKQLTEDRNTLLIQQLDRLRRESESRISMMEGIYMTLNYYSINGSQFVLKCAVRSHSHSKYLEQLSSQKKHHAKQLQEMEASHKREVQIFFMV